MICLGLSMSLYAILDLISLTCAGLAAAILPGFSCIVHYSYQQVRLLCAALICKIGDGGAVCQQVHPTGRVNRRARRLNRQRAAQRIWTQNSTWRSFRRLLPDA